MKLLARWSNAALALALILSYLLVAWLPGSQAASLGQELPPPRVPSGEEEALPFLDSGVVPPELPQAAPLAYVPWSKLVFQSYRNGNWEIYLADSDGFNQTRLTYDGASDIHPRLNRGCTRIAFASNRQGNYEIYTMNLDGTGLARLTANSGDDVQPFWSPDGARIAFQSYRDGQSEIYVMNADGSGQTRLTTNGAYDGEPAWSPDGSRIAFTSNRGGGYQIWVMNTDGSEPVSLSGQPYSENPVWSPDSSQIAYDADADGDGWQELWLMNADGTDQRQLYDPDDPQDAAWARSWSPDGKYVGFTEISLIYSHGNWYWTQAYLRAWHVTGGFFEYLGSGATDWRPDWQTTDGGVPTSSVTALPAQSPGPFTVNWSGSDTGPSGLKNYDVQVKDGADGAWTDWQMGTTATLASYPGVGGHTYYFRSRARDNGGNVEAWPPDYDTWTTVEAFPPRTVVVSLPAYFRNGQTIQWYGMDPGGSGIQTYDVQYRDTSGGGWTDWQVGTASTSASFSGTAGHTYFFRSRATDQAQNIEDWPPGAGDTYTTLYTWGISGVMHDNTDTPVAGAPVSTTPEAFAAIPSTINGDYAAYVVDSATSYSAEWNKSGYLGLPTTSFDVSFDASVDAILPPTDNVVLNWGFESGSLGSEWLATGVFTPIATDTVEHTGGYAAQLGSRQLAPPWNLSNHRGGFPQIVTDGSGIVHVVWTYEAGDDEIYYIRRASDGTWSSPQNLSHNTGDSADPQLAVDKGGVVHVVWVDNTPGTYNIYYARRGNDGIWSNPLNISSSSMGAFLPQVAVDGNETVHVVWQDHTPDSADIYYSRRTNDGTWSIPLNISNTTGQSEEAQLAVDESDGVHVVWHDDTPGNRDIYYAYRADSGTWSAPRNVSSNPTESYPPRLAIDGNGVVHVVWFDTILYGDSDIYYAQRGSDGTWSSPLNISSMGVTNFPELAADKRGFVHVVWDDGSEVYYIQRGSNGTWSTRQNISHNPRPSYAPQLAMDESGGIYVAWLDYPPLGDSTDIYCTWRGSNGAWSSPQNISNSPGLSFSSELAVDETEAVHIVWTDESSGVEGIYYVGPAFADQSGDSSVVQAVTVPITISTPTLSFLYQLGGASAANNTWLSVQVDNGVAATILFSTTTPTDDWTHRWYDLAAWSGQTITMTFNVHETAGRPLAWAYLDEVTLGSAYPDLWVNKSPASALPGEQVTFAIEYGNRGGAPASGVHLTDTLPAGLTFVAASTPPLTTTPSLVWDVGDLPAKSASHTLLVTATVAPETPLLTTLINVASIGTDTPELEVLNNETQATIFVGRRLYLPVITKAY
jgi:uncharacterized repeat protein (TIGR01451 family)